MPMTPRTAARLAWGLFGLFVVNAVVGLVLLKRNEGGFGDDIYIIFAVITLPLVGAVIASRRPQNAIGWLLIWAALGGSFGFVLGEWARYATVNDVGPRWVALTVAVLSNVMWLPSFGMIPTFLLLLFPNGRLPSPRWRPVAWGIGAVIALAVVTFLLQPGPLELEQVRIENPLGIEALEPLRPVLEAVIGPLLLAAVVLSFASLVVRYRRASRDERQQLKWFTYAAAFAVAAFALGDVLPDIVGQVVFWVGMVGLSASLAVAILKYRLYDIDVVIRKTVVYGLLAAFITAVYVGIVVGVGALVGSQGNLGLSILATAIIAIAFHPLRERARHLANHLVYGKRATPYEVLSEFSDRLGTFYSTEDLLPRMGRILREGTGARRVEVWLRLGDELRPAVSWPDEGAEPPPPIPLRGEDVPRIPAMDHVYPVRHRGELLGVAAVSKAAEEPLSPAEDKLLRDLASQAGLVLRNVRLTEELRAKIEELQASRQRIVAAQDTERRRIERNIHDGAQQQLVALAVKMRLARAFARKDPERAEAMLDELRADTQDALETLRDLARGIYPPLLADQGLPAALEAQARKSGLPVTVSRHGIGRYPQEVEAAAYFCVLEALQNAAKHAEAKRIDVRLSATDGELRFEVEDDGVGFDAGVASRGAGVHNMSDRVHALGGELEVASRPGEGTRVRGRIPVRGDR